jgi:two-component system, NarL family, sensor histidine kinase UhpB
VVYLSKEIEKNVLFDALMQGITDQAFLIEIPSMRLVNVSQSVCKAFNEALPALQKKEPETLMGLTKEDLNAFVSSHQVMVKLAIPNKQNNIHFYHLKAFKIALVEVEKQSYLFAIKSTDQSSNEPEFDENDTRFKVLVKNTPGLVFEFRIDEKGQILFHYLSDGCKALLGIEPILLTHKPNAFFDIMNKDDFEVFEERLKVSAAELTMLNWEGRFWIEEWHDTKWVNLRCSPKKFANGMVQWSGIMTNITQSKLEKVELEDSRERLAALSDHLNTIKEQERGRISREIHDDLGGNLTVIKMGLTSLLKSLPAEQTMLIEKIQDLKVIVDKTFDTAHRISGDLRPNILELGIVAALDWQSKEFEKQMDIPCYFVTNNQDGKGTAEQATTLFRVCQEAMSNIAKYAKATRVDVALLFGKEEIKMYITDDGVGINPGDVMKPNAFGLRGMEERVVALQGKFSIEKATDKGTNVIVSLPNSSHEAFKVN